MPVVPCGDNVLLRRESCSGAVLRLNPLSDTAVVVSADSLPDGARVVVRPGAAGLHLGDLELVSIADILAIVD